MLAPTLDSVLNGLDAEDSRTPPLDKWHPELSGDIDIRIDASGVWFHLGGEIKRQALVNLFASILRREDDGEYYLVTPVEKWRIRVERLPLVIVGMDVEEGARGPSLVFTTNTSSRVPLDRDHPIKLIEQAEGGPVPAVDVRHGLQALISRSVYYRLAERVEPHLDTGVLGVVSGGNHFAMEL
ncbi:MAG: hypothetical protein ACI9GW_003630 [Halieaceae bacterium]|jgi:hypothetical protein